jgi:hexosaminidase
VHATEKKVEAFARTSWNRTVIFWQDVFDNAGNTKFDTARTVFQIWRSQQEMAAITAAGYRAILSAGWYLDKYHPNGDPDVYHFWDTWQSMYPVDPQAGLTQAQAKLVLGGEAAMWGEYVDSWTLDPQLWPRAAAIAERLWSSASVTDLPDAERRITALSCYLRQNEIFSVPLGPGYCPVPPTK